MRAAWALVATAAIVAGSTMTAPTRADAASSCLGGALQIVAHEDDDLLFQNPDVLRDVRAGRCVRTVFVTAGDAAQGESYWKSREDGSKAAYAQMAGVANAWTVEDAEVAQQPVRRVTLRRAPTISLVFMRLPDGNRRGTGMANHRFESLKRLWEGSITSISAVDGTATYTGTSLRAALVELMSDFQPTTVRTQDWTAPFGKGDSADHVATAQYVRAADSYVAQAHTLVAYGGYPTWTRMPNVSGADLTAKHAAFHAYLAHDSQLCLEFWCADHLVYTVREARQYVIATESVSNRARRTGVTVTASAQDTWSGQSARNAVDGAAAGYPDAAGAEWVAARGKAGTWIQLNFPTPTLIDGVVLSDRPNLDDQITGGTLLFSDGSTIATGALADNGSARTIAFAPRIVTSLRLTVDSVSASTRNVGLAELEAHDHMPPATSTLSPATVASR